jgi:hypothetical protein
MWPLKNKLFPHETALKTSANFNVENPESQFHFNWNAEYGTWNLIDDEKDTASC